jgi:iron complex transport system substrate-binding protein
MFCGLGRSLGAAALVGSAWLVVAGCDRTVARAAAGRAPHEAPARIVSLAPSVTEILFGLGLGDRVVGVTRFCDFPAAARALPQVGGYLDLDYEGIVALEPDLVIAIQDHDQARRRLEQLGLATLQVNQQSLAGILGSIRSIAEACGEAERGRQMAADIEREVRRIADRTRGLEALRTLVVVGRDAGTGSVKSVWVAGRATFYHELLEIAGGVNVSPASAVAYPELSREGLYQLDPDVILDLMADLDARHLDQATAVADWRSLSELRAVRSRRVHVLAQELMVVPGPRIAELVELFARALHPEAGW